MLSAKEDELPTVHISFERKIVAFIEKYKVSNKKCLKEKR